MPPGRRQRQLGASQLTLIALLAAWCALHVAHGQPDDDAADDSGFLVSPLLRAQQELQQQQQQQQAEQQLQTDQQQPQVQQLQPVAALSSGPAVPVLPDLPPTDPRLGKLPGSGCQAPEQVHLTLWSATSVLVSWVMCDAQTGPTVRQPAPTPGRTELWYHIDPQDCEAWRADRRYGGYDNVATAAAADGLHAPGSSKAPPHKKQRRPRPIRSRRHADQILPPAPRQPPHYAPPPAPNVTAEPDYNPEPDAYGPHTPEACRTKVRAEGVTTSYAYDYTSLGDAAAASNYASGIISHVLLKDLLPGVRYRYQIPGALLVRSFDFKLPEHGHGAFPLRLGVFSDPGQTNETALVLQRLGAAQPDLLSLVGDFSYADLWRSWVAPAAPLVVSWQPKWDTWGRLFEPLLSKVPLMHTHGERDIERLPGGVRFRSYNHRYPVPQTPRQRASGPTSFPDVTSSQAWSNLFWAVELPGVLKAIHLTSYSPGQPMTAMEAQYKWLQRELEKCDRDATPWLLVSWHAPWYSSYAAEFKQNEAMRKTYEALLVRYKVDIVLNGHVHAFERKARLANNTADACGPVSITLGDAGNTEGLDRAFIEQDPQPQFCSNSVGNASLIFPWYQPQASFLFESNATLCKGGTPGCFCYGSRPTWSLARQPSFGFGTLDFLSAERAVWRWYASQAPAGVAIDEVVILRGSSGSCP